MKSLNISDFEEEEYNLENIGLPGYYFCIEETVKYIYGHAFYMEIDNALQIIQKDNNYVLKNGDDSLIIPAETYEFLKDLF